MNNTTNEMTLFAISAQVVAELDHLSRPKRALTLFGDRIIHRNLRFILLCQSAVIQAVAATRLLLVFPVKLLSGDIFWVETEINFVPAQFLFNLPLFFRMSLGHVIIIERTMATFRAHTYERLNGKAFSATWFSAVILIAICNEVIERFGHRAFVTEATLFSLVVAFIFASVGLVDIFIFARLWSHNKSKYEQEFAIVNNATKNHVTNYNLTKRYQHLENIRTTLQLWPTLLIYALTQLNIVCRESFDYFLFEPDDYPMEIISQCQFLCVALFNLLIEITTIACHPILRQNLSALLRRLSPIRIGGTRVVSLGSTVGHVNGAPMPQNISSVAGPNQIGASPSNRQLTERHFELLQQAWT